MKLPILAVDHLVSQGARPPQLMLSVAAAGHLQSEYYHLGTTNRRDLARGPWPKITCHCRPAACR